MNFCEESCNGANENIWNALIIYHWFLTEIVFELCYSAPLNIIKMGFVFTGYFFCRYANDAYFILALANCSPILNKIIRYNMSKVHSWIMDMDVSWPWYDLAFLSIATWPDADVGVLKNCYEQDNIFVGKILFFNIAPT